MVLGHNVKVRLIGCWIGIVLDSSSVFFKRLNGPRTSQSIPLVLIMDMGCQLLLIHCIFAGISQVPPKDTIGTLKPSNNKSSVCLKCHSDLSAPQPVKQLVFHCHVSSPAATYTRHVEDLASMLKLEPLSRVAS